MTELYTKEQVIKMLQEQSHNCQIERNKVSKVIDGEWYVLYSDTLKEPLVNFPTPSYIIENSIIKKV